VHAKQLGGPHTLQTASASSAYFPAPQSSTHPLSPASYYPAAQIAQAPAPELSAVFHYCPTLQSESHKTVSESAVKPAPHYSAATQSPSAFSYVDSSQFLHYIL
jgi:hypothetical protein